MRRKLRVEERTINGLHGKYIEKKSDQYIMLEMQALFVMSRMDVLIRWPFSHRDKSCEGDCNSPKGERLFLKVSTRKGEDNDEKRKKGKLTSKP